jgi:hypothetical protein
VDAVIKYFENAGFTMTDWGEWTCPGTKIIVSLDPCQKMPDERMEGL